MGLVKMCEDPESKQYVYFNCEMQVAEICCYFLDEPSHFIHLYQLRLTSLTIIKATKYFWLAWAKWTHRRMSILEMASWLQSHYWSESICALHSFLEASSTWSLTEVTGYWKVHFMLFRMNSKWLHLYFFFLVIESSSYCWNCSPQIPLIFLFW